MALLTFLHHYLLWHYLQGFISIFAIGKNFYWFTIHKFGLANHWHSFFSPWKRITEDHRKAWDLEDLGEVLVVNIISRLIGIIFRSALILMSISLLIIQTMALILISLVWVLAPIIIPLCFFYGVLLVI